MKLKSFVNGMLMGGVIFNLMPSVQAQVVNATKLDSYCGSINYIPTINCDMVERNGEGTNVLKAIAWDDKNHDSLSTGWIVNSKVHVFVEDEFGNSVSFLANREFAAEPDIVIADDMNNPGNDYIIGVIYDSGDPFKYHYYDSIPHSILLDYWSITNVGTPSITATHLYTQQLSIRGTSPAHIDMWSDNNNQILGRPSLHEFAAVWNEYTSTTYQWAVTVFHDDIDFTLPPFNTPTAYPNLNGLNLGNRFPDVSCRTHNQTMQLMDIVYVNTNPYYAYNIPSSTGSLYYLQYQVNPSPSITSNFPIELFPNRAFARIESLSQSDDNLTPNAALWQVCAVVNTLAGTGQGWVIKGYNQTGTGILNNFYLSNLSNRLDHTLPAVAAGIKVNWRDPSTGLWNIGNQHYYTGHYTFGNDPQHYYAREVDAPTAALINPAHYRINLNPISGISVNNKYLALSSSSNSGFGLLSAWHDGAGAIAYKFSDNVLPVVFKPTAVEDVKSFKGLTLYPNPSVNHITINGISQIGNYRIVAMDGKTVAIDNSATNKITVSTLPSGSYIVYFRNGTTNHQLTFSKN